MFRDFKWLLLLGLVLGTKDCIDLKLPQLTSEPNQDFAWLDIAVTKAETSAFLTGRTSSDPTNKAQDYTLAKFDLGTNQFIWIKTHKDDKTGFRNLPTHMALNVNENQIAIIGEHQVDTYDDANDVTQAEGFFISLHSSFSGDLLFPVYTVDYLHPIGNLATKIKHKQQITFDSANNLWFLLQPIDDADYITYLIKAETTESSLKVTLRLFFNDQRAKCLVYVQNLEIMYIGGSKINTPIEALPNLGYFNPLTITQDGDFMQTEIEMEIDPLYQSQTSPHVQIMHYNQVRQEIYFIINNESTQAGVSNGELAQFCFAKIYLTSSVQQLKVECLKFRPDKKQGVGSYGYSDYHVQALFSHATSPSYPNCHAFVSFLNAPPESNRYYILKCNFGNKKISKFDFLEMGYHRIYGAYMSGSQLYRFPQDFIGGSNGIKNFNTIYVFGSTKELEETHDGFSLGVQSKEMGLITSPNVLKIYSKTCSNIIDEAVPMSTYSSNFEKYNKGKQDGYEWTGFGDYSPFSVYQNKFEDYFLGVNNLKIYNGIKVTDFDFKNDQNFLVKTSCDTATLPDSYMGGLFEDQFLFKDQQIDYPVSVSFIPIQSAQSVKFQGCFLKIRKYSIKANSLPQNFVEIDGVDEKIYFKNPKDLEVGDYEIKITGYLPAPYFKGVPGFSFVLKVRYCSISSVKIPDLIYIYQMREESVKLPFTSECFQNELEYQVVLKPSLKGYDTSFIRLDNNIVIWYQPYVLPDVQIEITVKASLLSDITQQRVESQVQFTLTCLQICSTSILKVSRDENQTDFTFFVGDNAFVQTLRFHSNYDCLKQLTYRVHKEGDANEVPSKLMMSGGLEVSFDPQNLELALYSTVPINKTISLNLKLINAQNVTVNQFDYKVNFLSQNVLTFDLFELQQSFIDLKLFGNFFYSEQNTKLKVKPSQDCFQIDFQTQRLNIDVKNLLDQAKKGPLKFKLYLQLKDNQTKLVNTFFIITVPQKNSEEIWKFVRENLLQKFSNETNENLPNFEFTVSSLGRVRFKFSEKMVLQNLEYLNSNALDFLIIAGSFSADWIYQTGTYLPSPLTHRALSVNNQPQDQKYKTFTWQVLSMDERHIEIQLYFENPLEISSGQKLSLDQLQVTILDSSLFQSEETSQTIPFGTKAKADTPPQFESEDDAESVSFLSQLFQGLFYAGMTESFLLNIVLGYGISEIWAVLHALQIIATINSLNLMIPINVQEFFEFLTNLSEFQLINLEPLYEVLYLKLYETSENDTGRRLQKKKSGKTKNTQDEEEFENETDLEEIEEPTDLFNEKVAPMLFNFTLVVLGFIAYSLLSFPALFNQKVKALKTQIYYSIFWNGLLRTFIEAYLAMILTTFEDLEETYQWFTAFTFIYSLYSFLTLLALIVLPLLMFFYFRFNTNNYTDRTFKKRFGEVISDLSHRRINSSWFFLIFCYRRLLLSALIVFSPDFYYWQVMCSILIHQTYLTFFGLASPMKKPSFRRLEYFNEICIFAAFYFTLVFTDFLANTKVRYELGFILNGIVLINFLVNYAYINWDKPRICYQKIKGRSIRFINKRKRNMKYLVKKLKKSDKMIVQDTQLEFEQNDIDIPNNLMFVEIKSKQLESNSNLPKLLKNQDKEPNQISINDQSQEINLIESKEKQDILLEPESFSQSRKITNITQRHQKQPVQELSFQQPLIETQLIEAKFFKLYGHKPNQGKEIQQSFQKILNEIMGKQPEIHMPSLAEVQEDDQILQHNDPIVTPKTQARRQKQELILQQMQQNVKQSEIDQIESKKSSEYTHKLLDQVLASYGQSLRFHKPKPPEKQKDILSDEQKDENFKLLWSLIPIEGKNIYNHELIGQIKPKQYMQIQRRQEPEKIHNVFKFN